MNRRDFLQAGVIGTAGLLAGAGGLEQVMGAAQKSGKNVLLIMADDLGPNELGCYGSLTIKTPNIDKLAANGMRFNTCYTVPVCAPSRILLMTGRYGFRTRHYNMGSRPGGPDSYKPKLDFTQSEKTFGHLVKQRGYTTALAGKWQLVPPSFNKIPESGFDEHLNWAISFEEGYGIREQFPNGREGTAGSRYFHPSLLHNGKRLKTKADDFGPDFFTNFLIDFMKRNHSAGKNFLAYYPMALPHRPIGPTPDHPDQPVDNSDAALKYNVEYIDKLVGRMVASLEEMGIRDETLIIFTGDNGTEKQGKNTPTEAGAKVPLVVNCPGLVRKGVVSDALVDFSDIFPTIAEVTHSPMFTDREYDGHSLIPALTGQKAKVRDWIFSFMGQFRVLRTKDWLLENECVDYKGDLYYCGGQYDPAKYENMTHSNAPRAIMARKELDKILAKLPAPDLSPEDRVWFLQYLKRYSGGEFDLPHAYPKGYEPTYAN